MDLEVQERNKDIQINYVESMNEKILLNVQDLCVYTGLGKTKIREILHRKDAEFVVKVGNRLYAHKKKFNEYIEKCAKYNIPL